MLQFCWTQGQLHLITILRDPVDRVLSVALAAAGQFLDRIISVCALELTEEIAILSLQEFYYAKNTNLKTDWKRMYPEQVQPHVVRLAAYETIVFRLYDRKLHRQILSVHSYIMCLQYNGDIRAFVAEVNAQIRNFT